MTDTKKAITTKNNPNIVSLDENCSSCNGQIPYLKDQFKMACLKYAPSKVLFDGYAYDRQELIEMREQILFEQQNLFHMPRNYKKVQGIGKKLSQQFEIVMNEKQSENSLASMR